MAVSALAVEAAGQDGQPHQWVRMIPMGTFGGQRDGRGPWVVDGPQHAAEIVAASQARAADQDPVVDYDHQSEVALDPEKRFAAPASGWMKELQARPDGIYARVEWTAAAARRLKAKAYRYISPVFLHEQPHADGRPMRVTRLLRAGLTNNPCLPELAAVASQHPHATSGTDMDIKKVAKALGLADTATEAEVDAALAGLPALKVGAQTALSAIGDIAIAAGLSKDAKTAEVVTAVAAAKASTATADPARFVPRETYDALAVRVGKVEGSLAEEKAVAAVDAAIEGGKVVPANRDWALGYAKKDPDGFATFVGAQPAIIEPGRRRPLGNPTEVTVTPEEVAIAAQMGVSREQLLESKKALAKS